MKIVVIRPTAGSRDCAYEVRYIECAQRHFRSRRADQGVLPPRKRWPGEDTQVEGCRHCRSRRCRSVAEIPLGQGSEILFGHVLVCDRARSCALLIPAGACAAVVCRLRPQRESNCCTTLFVECRGQRASTTTHPGLPSAHQHRRCREAASSNAEIRNAEREPTILLGRLRGRGRWWQAALSERFRRRLWLHRRHTLRRRHQEGQAGDTRDPRWGVAAAGGGGGQRGGYPCVLRCDNGPELPRPLTTIWFQPCSSMSLRSAWRTIEPSKLPAHPLLP